MTARKIIVGYDRSTDARAAATWALDEASRTGALVELFYAYECAFALDQAAARETDLHVIRACDAAVAGRWESGPMVTEAVLAGERARLDDLVDGWRKKFPDVTVTTEVVEDHPAAALIRAGAPPRWSWSAAAGAVRSAGCCWAR
jgi:nucleotide-binding universal stress UspA family protein